MVSLFGCVGKKSCLKNQKYYTAKDNEYIWLKYPEGDINLNTPFKGIVYNAVDKDYIENKNGINLQLIYKNFSPSDSLFMKYDPYNTVKNTHYEYKTFQIIAINNSLNPAVQANDYTGQITSLSFAENLDFCIDKRYLYGYERILIWTLMPRAIEKVEYKTFKQRIEEKIDYYDGDKKNPIVCFTLKSGKHKSSEKSTLYLINGIEIPEKVFNAINPVFIRSLSRITDTKELNKYRKKRLKEVVVIETFTHKEIIAPKVILSTGQHLNIFYVNDIKITEDIFCTLKPAYFKEYRIISAKNENYMYAKGKHVEDQIPQMKTIHKAVIE